MGLVETDLSSTWCMMIKYTIGLTDALEEVVANPMACTKIHVLIILFFN